MSRYTATISYRRGDDTESEFAANRYHRAHHWAFDGGAVILASASPLHVPVPFSDPAAVDPEEAFVAALSSCHMLFFLHLAAHAGWIVDAYTDAAEGIMGTNEAGRTAITRVTLRPRVNFSGPNIPDTDTIAKMHHAAHERCYLANSVRSEVVVESCE